MQFEFELDVNLIGFVSGDLTGSQALALKIFNCHNSDRGEDNLVFNGRDFRTLDSGLRMLKFKKISLISQVL